MKLLHFIIASLTLSTMACGGNRPPARTPTPAANATSTLAPLRPSVATTTAPSALAPTSTLSAASTKATDTPTPRPVITAALPTPTASVRATTALPLATATPLPAPVATSTVAGAIRITLQSHGVEQWGRPPGMDDRSKGCNSKDDSRPVRRYELRLLVANETNSPIAGNDWYAYFFKANGAPAFTCFIPGPNATALPNLGVGGVADVKFTIYVEPGEVLVTGSVKDNKRNMTSNVINIPKP